LLGNVSFSMEKKSMFTTSKGSLLSGKSNLLKKVSSSVEKIPCLL